ncbi:hypothetical protein [Arcobacter sp. CECT 8985]|uniref:hypothetical protein n=1 Tax=Arcobacter sp. CECT 8985 TaxID=1935424 RepID=UPI00100A8AD4|nr:hypothetical protein [Arcobacter sp. CECT 8985]RXJ88080.1 hypothetical protein CRU93_00330 [Arcobacter sp. CECT 8985]
MPSINKIVDSFNIGFFSTKISTVEPINLSVSKPEELKDFNGTLTEISKTPTEPKFNDIELDGVKYDKNNNEVPTKIIIKNVMGHTPFFDKYGHWDFEAEANFYKENEKEYSKKVINDWIKDNGYADLENKATLMKALLAKANL